MVTRFSKSILYYTALFVLLSAHATTAERLDKRWFYVCEYLQDEASLQRTTALVNTASAHGLNGMVLQAGMGGISTWDAKKIKRLKDLKEHCSRKGIEIIPLMMSAGYGFALASRDGNILAGQPVRDVLFKVENGRANIVNEELLTTAEGGFENCANHRVKGFDQQDRPGTCTFIDTEVVKEGKCSLRLENFADNQKRVRLNIVLTKPYKHYVVSLWAKADGLKTLSICYYTKDRQLFSVPFTLKSDGWQKIESSICTMDNAPVTVWIGAWGVTSGKLWLDSIRIFEPGLVNVLRRSGTPVTVRKKATGEICTEGTDFEPIADPQLKNSSAYHTPPSINILPNGTIKSGEELLVSYYTPILLRTRQPVLCMSEPKVYELWKESVTMVAATIKPQTWFLDMDEIRGGGWCTDCKARKDPQGKPMSMAMILGDCITRQVAMITSAVPGAEVAVWGDMLDPNHNAKRHFYTVPGGYTDSWNYIPRDMLLVPWQDTKASESLKHFSSNGFKTIAGAYYDTGNLDNCKNWLNFLNKTPRAAGIMYTTWKKQYELLAAFGDLVTGGPGNLKTK